MSSAYARDDGTVRVSVERPVDFGFDHAEYFLPAVKWFNVEGFSTDDLNFLPSSLDQTLRLSSSLQNGKTGSAVSALAPDVLLLNGK